MKIRADTRQTDPYGKEPNSCIIAMEPVLTMPVHGFCQKTMIYWVIIFAKEVLILSKFIRNEETGGSRGCIEKRAIQFTCNFYKSTWFWRFSITSSPI